MASSVERDKKRRMAKTKTTHYDIAEHLRTREERAAYLEACREEGDGDAAFIAKVLDDIARANNLRLNPIPRR